MYVYLLVWLSVGSQQIYKKGFSQYLDGGWIPAQNRLHTLLVQISIKGQFQVFPLTLCNIVKCCKFQHFD